MGDVLLRQVRYFGALILLRPLGLGDTLGSAGSLLTFKGVKFFKTGQLRYRELHILLGPLGLDKTLGSVGSCLTVKWATFFRTGQIFWSFAFAGAPGTR